MTHLPTAFLVLSNFHLCCHNFMETQKACSISMMIGEADENIVFASINHISTCPFCLWRGGGLVVSALDSRSGGRWLDPGLLRCFLKADLHGTIFAYDCRMRLL